MTKEDEILSGWWNIKFEIRMGGKDISFKDLSEDTQEHISKEILRGYTAGEIVEFKDK